MAYTSINFKHLKDLKAAVKAGEKIEVFNPGLGGPIPLNGTVYLEGPHYPQPHKWYAKAIMEDGYIKEVK